MAEMNPSAVDMVLAMWNGYSCMYRTLEDMHVSDAPSSKFSRIAI
jgi:hypothetical protein